MTYEALFEKLKKREFAPVYLLMGEEPFFIDQLADYMEANMIDEADRDFNQVIFYANDKDVDAARIVGEAKEYPFGVPYRLVIVKEARDLKNFDLIKTYAENPSPTTILVICHKYGKLKAAQYKPFEKNGILFTSEKIKDNKLAAWVQEQARLHEYSISASSAASIAENIGNDLTRINNEFLKLKIFLPPNSEITPDIIEKYIGISKEYNVFELQNALGERNLSRIYKITFNLSHNLRENPMVKIIAVLYPFFYKMLAWHLAPDHSPASLSAIYGNSHPYILKLNTSYAQRYSLTELKKIISILREYDMKVKGVDSAAPEEELLKEMIYKIIS